jgi:hypothetical protein
MKKIDILNLSKYLRRTGDNKLARVGHVNYALDVTNQITTNVFANNLAALAGGLTVGTLYSTASGEVRVVV